MNIKNRIQKIENGLNLDSEFCRCPRQIIIKPRTENEAPKPPEICKDCGKEISVLHCTFKFTGDIELKLPPYKVIGPGDEFQEEQL